MNMLGATAAAATGAAGATVHPLDSHFFTPWGLVVFCAFSWLTPLLRLGERSSIVGDSWGLLKRAISGYRVRTRHVWLGCCVWSWDGGVGAADDVCRTETVKRSG